MTRAPVDSNYRSIDFVTRTSYQKAFGSPDGLKEEGGKKKRQTQNQREREKI